MRFLCPAWQVAACRRLAILITPPSRFGRRRFPPRSSREQWSTSSGRPVPRALVRVIDAAGNETTRRSPTRRGRCGIVLPVAPVEEHVIVSATRTEAPTSQAGASATVFTAADLERRQTPQLAQLLESTPGAMIVRAGARRAVNVVVRTRRRERLRQDPARRHAAQRAATTAKPRMHATRKTASTNDEKQSQRDFVMWCFRGFVSTDNARSN